MASTGVLVVSPARVLAAIAFQSVITPASSMVAVAPAAAVAVPVARVEQDDGRERRKPAGKMRLSAADRGGGALDELAHIAPPALRGHRSRRR
jgi:hypothetical protein